jgi:hypothetical protein
MDFYFLSERVGPFDVIINHVHPASLAPVISPTSEPSARLHNVPHNIHPFSSLSASSHPILFTPLYGHWSISTLPHQQTKLHVWLGAGMYFYRLQFQASPQPRATPDHHHNKTHGLASRLTVAQTTVPPKEFRICHKSS